jgi:protein-S-isoprenylcysteine O-methyltransferase Ste14
MANGGCEEMRTRTLIFIVNYVVLIGSCEYGAHSLHIGGLLSQIIAVAGALIAPALLSLAVVIHRSFPKVHNEAADFPKLLTSGPYGYVRHPLYSALIALNYSISVAFLSAYAILASTLLFPLFWYLAKKEESDLTRRWGQEYVEYRRRTPMFFPKWRRRKKG